MYICVSRVLMLSLSTMVGYQTVPAMWCFCFTYCILYNRFTVLGEIITVLFSIFSQGKNNDSTNVDITFSAHNAFLD